MSELRDFIKDEKLHSTEGRKGVENLAKLARYLGYKDPCYYGQFQGGCIGDLIEFLKDNPGAVEGIREFMIENFGDEE